MSNKIINYTGLIIIEEANLRIELKSPERAVITPLNVGRMSVNLLASIIPRSC